MRRRFLTVLLALLLYSATRGVLAQTNCSPSAFEQQKRSSPGRMPEFRGCSLAQVQRVIKGLELRLTVQTEGNTAPANTIVDQAPIWGAPIPKTRELTLTVSTGVPDAVPAPATPVIVDPQLNNTGKKQRTPGIVGTPTEATGSKEPTKVPEPSPAAIAPAVNGVPADIPVSKTSPVAIARPRTCQRFQIDGTDPQGKFHAGQPVSFVFTIHCGDRSAGAIAFLNGNSLNLRSIQMQGACKSFPCTAPLQEGQSLELDVTARPAGPGFFSYALSARSRQQAAAGASVTPRVLSGMAVSREPGWIKWLAWIWVVVLGAAAVPIVSAIRQKTRVKQESQWQNSFRVAGTLQGLTGSSGPLPLRGPPIGVTACLEAGSARTSDDLRVTKEEPYDG